MAKMGLETFFNEPQLDSFVDTVFDKTAKVLPKEPDFFKKLVGKFNVPFKLQLISHSPLSGVHLSKRNK